MDDVDAVQAQIARNMLESGDWVTARLDGVAYLEKSPLIYWMMAASYRVFGVHDWSARLPLALAVVMLCFVTYRFARWAFGEDAGLYSGLILATSVGLFLFTRILIPDATLTLVITGAIWCWLRLLEPDEESAHARWWAAALGLCLAAGASAEGVDRCCFPHWNRTGIHGGQSTAVVARFLAQAAHWNHHARHPGSCSSLACAGNYCQSAILRLFASQRAGRLQGLFLVLLLQ
jgi:hypothetical protein